VTEEPKIRAAIMKSGFLSMTSSVIAYRALWNSDANPFDNETRRAVDALFHGVEFLLKAIKRIIDANVKE
jgi:hypothetical protein